MRRYIIASHHLLANGLKDTLNFLTSMDGIIDISAYMDDTDLPTQIKELFDSFDPEDEVVMMTDMLGGQRKSAVLPICKRTSAPDLRYQSSMCLKPGITASGYASYC